MLVQILIFFFVIALAISLVIKFTVIYHFRKFSLPEDPAVKKIISLHKWGTIIIALFCVFLLVLFAVNT